MNWKGVIPAITTNLDASGAIDHAALGRHCEWMIRSGCVGIVCCGSLGEAATLSFDEKLAIAATCVRAVGSQAPVVLGIASLSTAEAVQLARGAEQAGCAGLMVLPPYVYSTRLARDEGARQRDPQRDETLLHALQQSAGVQDGLPAGADRRAGSGASATCTP